MPGNAPVVHFACSRGGHMDLLLRLEHVLGDRRVVWVTQQSARAHAMRAEGLPVYILGEWTGSMVRGAAGLIWRSLGLVLRRRPRLVITSGSGGGG